MTLYMELRYNIIVLIIYSIFGTISFMAMFSKNAQVLLPLHVFGLVVSVIVVMLNFNKIAATLSKIKVTKEETDEA